jgi:phosphoglucomutase
MATIRPLARKLAPPSVLAITQAIRLQRKHEGIDGPLFIGFGPRAPSEAAFVTALEVLPANGVDASRRRPPGLADLFWRGTRSWRRV